MYVLVVISPFALLQHWYKFAVEKDEQLGMYCEGADKYRAKYQLR